MSNTEISDKNPANACFALTCNYLNIDKWRSGNKVSNCQIWAETESDADIRQGEDKLS